MIDTIINTFAVIGVISVVVIIVLGVKFVGSGVPTETDKDLTDPPTQEEFWDEYYNGKKLK